MLTGAVNTAFMSVPQPHPHTLDIETLEREGTADLVNDPRFFAENVIEKRLAAFEALAIVTGIMAEEGLKLCFELQAEFNWTGPFQLMAGLQLVGFFMMCFVAFMDLLALAVFSLQLFFTIRLFTAGPTGFDKSKRFYQDNRMWLWRERALFCTKWSIVGFFASTGCLLTVKFYIEGAPEIEKESHKMKDQEYQGHKVLAVVVLAVFSVITGILTWVVREHHRVFDESYITADVVQPLMTTGGYPREHTSTY
eukprot:TRINITY_DN51222_c0_g1_i1.p1 TRINITY_DN51222_c0_g1~~TRINITY_DN51222_c0_g1_i1.p1  ORF type:complete len:252 (+),score=26.89 TRINITY_DN51222_c0_g1_i1:155-910(+)